MSQEQVLGMIRHILTTVGGIIVAKGVTDEGTMTAIVGGLVAVAGVVWSIWSNKQSQIVKMADKIETDKTNKTLAA